MSDIRPFKIEIPDDALERLRKKLELTNLAAPMEDEDGDRGAPQPDIKRLFEHWNSGFDWRKQEAKLNEMAQFKLKVAIDNFGEVDMHFVHQKSPVKGAIPLLFVHGWPGSFFEVSRILDLLTNPKDGGPAFHVVAPSLPNFGFSSRVTKKDFGFPQYAQSVHKIMIALGYNEYVTQGGDWGFFVTRALAHLYPKHVKGVHTNFAFAAFPAPLTAPLLFLISTLKFASALPLIGSVFKALGASYSDKEMSDLAAARDWFEGSGRGYFAIQSTKPQTLAFALNDSPVGLLGWIYEKLVDWTDDFAWTDDQILTWVSIYWFSEAGPGSAGYIYKEIRKSSANTGDLPLAKLQGWVTQPLGFTYLNKEIGNMPSDWTATMGRVVSLERHSKGGHFAAFERPEDLAGDLRKMYGRNGGAHGVVEGKSGF